MSAPRTLIIHSARLIDDAHETRDAWVAFEGARVAGTGTGDGWRVVPADETVDAAALAGPDAVLSPGFVDLHGHGGGGAAYDDGAAAIRTARAAHLRHGTTSAVLSLVSAPIDDLKTRVATIAGLVGIDGVLGSHLEGPFLDAAHKGAHDPGALHAPDTAELERLLDAGAGTIRQVTLAPELPGALAAVSRLAEAGTAVAVGHTGADAAVTRAAFDAGATILTHAFNAMPGLHHRAPGPVGAAIADDRVTLEIIADGVHLDPVVVAVAFAAAPGRIALVTDAMAAAAASDGRYALGDLDVEVRAGVARLADGTIAGSTLTHDAALRVAVAAGVPLAEALRALTAVPARAIGATGIGRLRPGHRADAVLLDGSLRVARVWAGGDPV
jgi:N-acetylglucosamine-6-phosphate deacetylase